MTTDFQNSLYEFIKEYILQKGVSPQFAEMIAAMGISAKSKSLLTRSLRSLEKKGSLILKKEGRYLKISLVNKGLPLLGRISAGVPIEAITDRHFLNLHQLFECENKFALTVEGESMIDEGILDGDIIVCKSRPTAREGEIVVALIDDHYTTLKRISYKVKGMITLIPANSQLKPRAYLPERILIQGIYVGLIRVNY